MMKRTLGVVVFALLIAHFSVAQMAAEKVDTAVISKIKDEGMNRSQVMEILSYLCDIYSPRLTGSPEYKRAADWVSQKLASWGLQNIYYDKLPFGKGWTLKRFHLNALQPVRFPVIAYPKAWTPGVKGTVSSDVVYFDAKTEADLEKFKGQLKGKFVLISDPRELTANFEPQARRLTDSDLLRLANAGVTDGGRQFRRMPDLARLTPAARDSAMRAMARQFLPDADSARITRAIREFMGSAQALDPKKLEMCLKEGALAALDLGRGDGGTMIVQAASVPQAGTMPFDQRVSPYDAKAPQIVPQVTLAAEHYNRLVRMIQKGQKVKLEMNLEVEFTPVDSTFNIIAEIPGTDLKDEIVMLGGHFDTWHAGTGATDDGTGVAACMEAARIIQTLGLKPRRTIRVGFWAAEEQGLVGSRMYVTKYFAERPGTGMMAMRGGGEEIKSKPDYEKFSVYFNHDNGTGKFRGVYMQGNEAARPIFRAWLAPFASMGAATLTIQNTSGTDHLSFDAVGLPGFQFIQDPVEYDTRTHHYNMDVYERVQADDMKQAATIMAAFAYNAAMRDEKFPRKPMPAPRPQAQPGGN